MSLDPRLHPFRPDLAHAALAGKVIAERYVKGDLRRVTAAALPIYRLVRGQGPMVSEALMGEDFLVLEVTGHWAWGQLASDNYVGYVRAKHLEAIEAAPTHRVAVPSSLIFSAPDLKSAPLGPVWLNARLTVTGGGGAWSALAGGGFVFTRHLAGLDQHAADFVAVAEQFCNVPYLWGGRTFRGLDCSGLVQTALLAAGRACPRDTDMMAATLGSALPEDDFKSLRRGDLVFWRGHLGIMMDQKRLLHANAHHLGVAIEPLAGAVARIAAAGSPVTALRRL
jgi:cell wall-associated NlpC family hydrolase